jgi:predicted RNA-binding protein Jag
MPKVEFSGKNTEEAINLAASTLNVPPERLVFTIISTGFKGILGLGAKKARILVDTDSSTNWEDYDSLRSLPGLKSPEGGFSSSCPGVQSQVDQKITSSFKGEDSSLKIKKDTGFSSSPKTQGIQGTSAKDYVTGSPSSLSSKTSTEILPDASTTTTSSSSSSSSLTSPTTSSPSSLLTSSSSSSEKEDYAKNRLLDKNKCSFAEKPSFRSGDQAKTTKENIKDKDIRFRSHKGNINFTQNITRKKTFGEFEAEFDYAPPPKSPETVDKSLRSSGSSSQFQPLPSVSKFKPSSTTSSSLETIFSSQNASQFKTDSETVSTNLKSSSSSSASISEGEGGSVLFTEREWQERIFFPWKDDGYYPGDLEDYPNLHFIEDKIILPKPLTPLSYEHIQELPLPSITPMAVNTIKKIIELMGFLADVEAKAYDDKLILTLNSVDNSLLIGRRGVGLDSLELLVNKVVKKEFLKKEVQDETPVRIIVDAEDYRSRRHIAILDKTLAMASQALCTRKSHNIPQLTIGERRIVRAIVSQLKDVNMQVQGTGALRNVSLNAVK